MRNVLRFLVVGVLALGLAGLARAADDKKEMDKKVYELLAEVINKGADKEWKPKDDDVARAKKRLVEFVSAATGGPLKYTGGDMKTVHKGMKIAEEEFEAAAADLKVALEKNGDKPA